MRLKVVYSLLAVLFLLNLISGCINETSTSNGDATHSLTAIENEARFKEAIQKHLTAVSNRDLPTLKSTLSPDGQMQLILPGTEIISSVDSFMGYHESWFQDTAWTFTTEIKNFLVGTQLGIATVEAMYREPERDGAPYFNRMTVSYVLAKQEGNWFIIKDHACSVEKSTDHQ